MPTKSKAAKSAVRQGSEMVRSVATVASDASVIMDDTTESMRAKATSGRTWEEYRDVFENVPIGFRQIIKSSNIRILVVDDDPDILNGTAHLLEKVGYIVDKSSNGEEALLSVRRHRPDLLLLDSKLPDVDGLEVCRRIKQDSALAEIFVVLISGVRVASDQQAEALEEGADGYIARPIANRELLARVKSFIDILSLNRTLRHQAAHLQMANRQLQERIIDIECAEKNTKASELRYRRLFESAKDGILILNARTGAIVDVNPFLIDLLGLTRDAFLGKKIWTLGFFKDIVANKAKFAELQTKEYVRYDHLPLETSDGRRIAVEFVSKLYRVNGHKVIQCNIRDITERKLAEMQLRKLSLAVEQNPASIVITDVAGVIEYVNPKFTQLTGYSLAEALGQNPRVLKTGEHPAEYYQLLWQTITAGNQWRGEFHNRKKNGDLYWESASISPIMDASGKITNFVAVKEDITERKRAAEVLLASRQLTEGIINAIPVRVFWKDKNLVYLGCNAVFAHDAGLADPRDIIGKDDYQMVWNEQAELYRADDRQVIESGCAKLLVEEHQTTPSGNTITLLTSKLPLRNGAGEICGVLGIYLDITARLATDERLRKQAALLDVASDAIHVRTLDNTVIFWNTAAEQLYGWSRAEALGRKITELGDVDHVAFEAAHAVLLAQGSWSGELKKISKAGKESSVFCSWTLSRDERGQPKEILAINTDITERLKTERLALRSQRLEALGTLAGGVAHDLNNALAPIMMSVALLQTEYPDGSEILETIQASVQRAADMVRQLLSFAKGAEGQRVVIEPSLLLKEMKGIIKSTFPKNIQVEVRYDNTTLTPVLGDPTQLHQVLLNLCVNARDAMPQGGKLTLEAENRELDAVYAGSMLGAKPGQYVVLRVGDTGTGIPPKTLDRIFEPFFTTKGPDKGTGLGLSTAMGIVKGHGGFLHVYSQPGHGSTFSVYLPADHTGTVAEPMVKPAEEFLGQGETILLVDDEAAVRKIGRAVLEKLNFKPLTAVDGADGLVQAVTHQAELRAVIVDEHMPLMDGLDFVRALRRLLPELPVVVASGRLDEATYEEFKTLGVTLRLDKPFTEAMLADALKNLLAAK